MYLCIFVSSWKIDIIRPYTHFVSEYLWIPRFWRVFCIHGNLWMRRIYSRCCFLSLSESRRKQKSNNIMIRHSLLSSLELYKLSEKIARVFNEKIKTNDKPFYSPGSNQFANFCLLDLFLISQKFRAASRSPSSVTQSSVFYVSNLL